MGNEFTWRLRSLGWEGMELPVMDSGWQVGMGPSAYLGGEP